MTDLKSIILFAQNYDQAAMYDLIKKFYPIIHKYTRKMNYDEDFKSDMILHLIETVHSIDLSRFRIQNDYAIINYIKNALYHKYILLSKNQMEIRHNENHFEEDELEEWLGADIDTTEYIDCIILNDTMKQILTHREYTCVKLIVIDGLSAKDVSQKLGISRQTVNENKNRGLRKLKIALY